jgi:hypothetical protein
VLACLSTLIFAGCGSAVSLTAAEYTQINTANEAGKNAKTLKAVKASCKPLTDKTSQVVLIVKGTCNATVKVFQSFDRLNKTKSGTCNTQCLIGRVDRFSGTIAEFWAHEVIANRKIAALGLDEKCSTVLQTSPEMMKTLDTITTQAAAISNALEANGGQALITAVQGLQTSIQELRKTDNAEDFSVCAP